MTERIPDYKLPAEAEAALHEVDLPGRYLPMSAIVLLRCAACHLARGESVLASSVTKCTQIERSNVSHGLAKLVKRGILEAEETPSNNGFPKRPAITYHFTEETTEVAKMLPPLSHCKYRANIQHAD